jgi:hypothetical protein
MKNCTICGIDITHKKSNRASKCEKCSRRINANTLEKIKHRGKNMSSVKKEILETYDICCAICKWSITKQIHNGQYQYQAGCEIHHIEKVSEGGKHVFENCILLCPNHHTEADLGIISKDVLFSYVTKNKEKLKEDKMKRSFIELCDVMKRLDNIF